MARKKHKQRPRSWAYGWWHDPPPDREELLQRVDPLLGQIRQVDETVAKIARGEGRVADLVRLEQILCEPFAIKGSNRSTVTLVQPTEVREALSSLSRELHLEVHAVDGQYPCYLLCRVSTDWDAPDVVLEALHVSTRNDFFPDERYVTLMKNGRSKTFLSLSPFREKLRGHLGRTWGEPPTEQDCDEVLIAVATLVLASAWYEDQRLPFTVADTFELRHFRSAIELVAFILGSDLYQLATGIQERGEDIIGFFRYVNENSYLADLLDRLSRDAAGNLADLEGAAREAFVELNRVFSTFLSTANALRDLEGIELYKIVLGCFGNLRHVAGREHWTPALEKAVRVIETSSVSAIERLISLQPGLRATRYGGGGGS